MSLRGLRSAVVLLLVACSAGGGEDPVGVWEATDVEMVSKTTTPSAAHLAFPVTLYPGMAPWAPIFTFYDDGAVEIEDGTTSISAQWAPSGGGTFDLTGDELTGDDVTWDAVVCAIHGEKGREMVCVFEAVDLVYLYDLER